MERSRRPYSIYARPAKKKNTSAAANWADAEIAKGHIIAPDKCSVLFGAFAEVFWDYDGDYIVRRLARGGHFSRSFAVTRASQLKRLLLPAFADRPLRLITRAEIEDWQMKLYHERTIAPATINRVLDNLKVIMKEAVRRGFITADPAAGLERLAEHPRPRGILFPAEIRLLFGPDALQVHWKGLRPPYVAAFLGIAAGLRTGEVRALRFRDVHDDFVTVTGSWEELHGRKGAKWNSERLVPIPSRVAEQLEAVKTASRYREPDDLIFSAHRRELPINKHVLQNTFYAALRGIGIDEAVRRERGLVWHSTRHTFNSLMRGKIDGGKLMRIVGHSNERTNLMYTHALPDDLAAVRTVQESVFAPVDEAKPQAQGIGTAPSFSSWTNGPHS